MSVAAVPSRITLDWPARPEFQAVGRLVLSGVAARIDLPVDRVEELGLALDTLARGAVVGDELSLEIDIARGALSASVGVFADDPLADAAVARVVAGLVDTAAAVAGTGGYRVVLAAGSSLPR